MRPEDLVAPKSLEEMAKEITGLPMWCQAVLDELGHARTVQAPGRIDLRLHHDASGKVNAVETRTKRRRNGMKP